MEGSLSVEWTSVRVCGSNLSITGGGNGGRMRMTSRLISGNYCTVTMGVLSIKFRWYNRAKRQSMARLRVKEVAQQKGFTRGKLSRAADVDTNTLKRVYDDPNYSPTLTTLEKLAKALGVKIADLIEEDT